MKTEDMCKYLDTLVNEFAERNKALAGQQDEIDVQFYENEFSACWSLSFNILKITFNYVKKGNVATPVSTLYSTAYLNKNSDFYFHIPQLTDMLGLENFNCYYFTFIENNERMKACFDRLSLFYVKNFDKLNALALGDIDYNKIFIDEFIRVGKLGDEDIPSDYKEKQEYLTDMNEVLSIIQFSRYTTFYAYDEFLRGNYKKSIEKYEKLKKRKELFTYENRLLDFMKRQGKPIEALPSECASRFDVKKYNGTSMADVKTILASILVCLVILTIPIALIMLAVNFYYDKTTILYDKMNPLYSILLAAIPSFFTGLGMVKGIGTGKGIHLIFYKNKKEAQDFLELLNPEKTLNSAKIIGMIAFVGVIAFYGILLQPYMKCYEDCAVFQDNDKIISSWSVRYDEVKAIYHIDGRYNMDDEYIDRASYVLVFEDNSFDTDSIIMSDDKIENDLLPLFEPYVDEIQYVHSDNDIKY